jgi:hypothetical protein
MRTIRLGNEGWNENRGEILLAFPIGVSGTLQTFVEYRTCAFWEIEHQADVYVLCVLGDRETDKDKVDPLNLDQWDFYVMKASLLNEESPTQTTIGEASLNKPDLIKVNYAELGARICDLSPSHGTQRTFGSPNQRRAAGYTAPKQSFGLGASTAPIPGLPLEFRSPNQRRSLVAQGNP